jgi:hypothetical protein
MALTNHVLVRLAASRVGFKKFTDYMIIGDDLVIFDMNVSMSYIGIIESLDMNVKIEDSI